MAQYDGSIRINTEIEYQNAKKELKTLEGSISKTADKIDSLRSKMDALKGTKVPTKEYSALDSELSKLGAEYDRIAERQSRFLQTGGKEKSSTYKRMEYDLDALELKQNQVITKMKELEQSGKAFAIGADTEEYKNAAAQVEQLNQKMTSDTQRQSELQSQIAERESNLAGLRENAVIGNQRIIETAERIKQLEQEIADLKSAGVTEGYKDYDSRIQELEQLKQEVKDYNSNIGQVKESYKKLGNTAKQSFDKMNKSTKKSGGLLETMATRFKGLALSLLIFNQISKAFRALSQGIKEGFSNLYKGNESFRNSVDGLKSSLLTLKNSFAAAFAPLVQMVIPYIQKAVEWITALINKIGQFIAAISGQKTYTKAIKQTTAAIKDQNKAQNKQLSGLDKLNNLTSGSSGGAGGDGGASNMFEEVPIDKNILDFIQKISEYAQKLKDIFTQGFWDGLGDWEYRWESIKESISSIKDSLIDIWTDSSVLLAADQWAQSVVYMLGSLVGSVASIGLTIAANLLGGIASYLSDNKDRIKEYLISMFNISSDINYMLAELFQSIAYVFEAFASENGIALTANLIGIFTDAFMGVTELFSKLARDILNIFIQSFVDNKEEFRTALEGYLGVLAEVTGTIKQGIDDTFDKLNEVYDAHFKPFFDSVAGGLSELVGHFLEFWNENVKPILDEWAAKFSEVWEEHIQPMLNNAIELFGDIADALKEVWETVLKPLIDWLIEYMAPLVLNVIDTAVKRFSSAFEMISDITNGVITIFRGLIKFLTGIFTGDWKKAWDGVTEIFDGVKNAIKGIVNGIIGLVESMANGVVKGMNTVIRAFNGLHFNIPNWVPGIGGNSYGFNIPEISNISIPRLATGTVVPPNREFMAVLGDNKREPEVVSPISTMKQAVQEAIAEAGGIGGSTGEMNLHLTVECDGYKLLQLIQKLDLEQFNRTGTPSFQI